MSIDEYVLFVRCDDGKWDQVSGGYNDLDDAKYSMENYYDKNAEIRVVAFMA